MATFKPFLLLISLLALALVSSSIPLRGSNKGDFIPCNIALNVKTLSDQCAGTTSNVSITLSYWRSPIWSSVTIPNLVAWNGQPPPPGGYFQAGQLANLAGPVDCDAIGGALCSLDITITGTGHSPTWGLEYIEVQSLLSLEYIKVRSLDFEKKTFPVNKWLTPENNYSVSVSSICPRLSKRMPGSTKGSLAI